MKFFDLEAITNFADCSNQIGELLVGAGMVLKSLVIYVLFGGVQVAGYVKGNDVVANMKV